MRIETAKIPDKANKCDRLLAKYEKMTNECFDGMDTVKKSMQDVYDSLDEEVSVQKTH